MLTIQACLPTCRPRLNPYRSKSSTVALNRKRPGASRRVRTDRAHAALVLDADGKAQGWCQYGSPEELSGIKHRRVYDKDAPPRPDWRITCFYVDKKHRG